MNSLLQERREGLRILGLFDFFAFLDQWLLSARAYLEVGFSGLRNTGGQSNFP